MSNELPYFKPWASEWLIRATLYILIVPSNVLFSLSVSNVNAAAGYYGVEPNDIQYSLIVLYAAIASFYVLEGRFFRFVPSKPYLLIAIMLEMIFSYGCYVTHSLHVLLALRFLQGIATAGVTSVCLNLVFSRLQSERAKEIGYSVFYGTLLAIVPLTTLVTAAFIDSFDFNFVYKCAIYSFVPGTALIFFMMNNVRLTRRVPLKRLEWVSFILYAPLLCLIGYVMVYGQQYYWLEDHRIQLAVAAIAGLLCLLLVRQLFLRRPYLHLNVLRIRNFRIGMLLLFLFYIMKGSLSVCTTYFATVLGMDPAHIGYVMISNIAGIALAAFISSRMLLLKVHMRVILLCGFTLMLLYHVQMCFMFQTQVDGSDFLLPLFVQGMGSGMLMVPIILFMVSAAPRVHTTSASGLGIFTRFMGFTTSIAMINFFSLWHQSLHLLRFQDSLSNLDENAVARLNTYKAAVVARGAMADQAGNIANGLLYKTESAQAQLRYAMDYYQFLSWLILAVILLIALLPSINKTIVAIRSTQPAPVAY